MENLEKKCIEFKSLKDKMRELAKQLDEYKTQSKEISKDISEHMVQNNMSSVSYDNVGTLRPTLKLMVFFPSKDNTQGKEELFNWLTKTIGEKGVKNSVTIPYQTLTSLTQGLRDDGVLKIDEFMPHTTHKETLTLSLTKK